MNIIEKRRKLSKQYRKELIERQTYHEYFFKAYLQDYNYIFQKVFFVDEWNFFIVDFYLPKYKLVIELDGSQHNKSEANKSYDVFRTRRLKSIGIKRVLRFKNEEVFDQKLIKQHLKLAMYECTKGHKNTRRVKREKKNDRRRVNPSSQRNKT